MMAPPTGPQTGYCPPHQSLLANTACPEADRGLQCPGDPTVCAGVVEYDWLQCESASLQLGPTWQIVVPAACSDAGPDADASFGDTGTAADARAPD
jgi:hypothetical protein